MVYSELLFFLGVLPVTTALSFLDRSAEYKNLILVLTSAVFVSWGKPIGCCLIFFTVLTEYAAGLAAEKLREKSRPAALGVLLLDLAINIGVFVLLGSNSLFASGSALHIRDALLPVGVGYYTVKAFSYTYDVFSGRCKAEKNIFCLMTYMLSYHFLLAGPVVRYRDIEPQIRRRTVTGKNINDGLTLFIIGLGKSVVIADSFAGIRAAGLGYREITFFGSWIGMIAFFAECWFSFTGLCDMAKALGLMNGFRYEDNYRDLSVKDLLGGFVTSANTSLIRFFKDIFSPVTKDNVFFTAVFALVGCILAAAFYTLSMPFFAVGCAVGFVVMIERLIPETVKERIPLPAKCLYIFLISTVLIGGIFFGDLESYKNWLLSLVGIGCKGFASEALKKEVLGNLFVIAAAFVIVCVPVKKQVIGYTEKLGNRSDTSYACVRLAKTALTAALLLLCVITLAAKAS